MNTMEELVNSVNILIELREAINSCENNLDGLKRKERTISEETIPSILQELGITEIKLEDGRKVSYKRDVFLKVSDDKQDQCFDWLVDNGLSGIIQVKVFNDFSKGEFEQAQELFKFLEKRDYSPRLIQSANTQTLKAEFRRRLENKQEVPLDLFNAVVVNKTKIK